MAAFFFLPASLSHSILLSSRYSDINTLIGPNLGGDDPIFGRRYCGSLADFFDGDRRRAAWRKAQATLHEYTHSRIVWSRSSFRLMRQDICIFIGCGASLLVPETEWSRCSLVYFDLPKNEIQYRSRAGSVRNIGAATA